MNVFWTELDPPAPEKYVRDPLGLQNMAEMLAEAIIPGITSRTVKVRYYSLLCWGLNLIERNKGELQVPEYAWDNTVEGYLMTFEKILVLSIVAHYSGKANVPDEEKPLLGIESADDMFKLGGSKFDLGSKYKLLINQRFQGCIGAYRTSLTETSLIQESTLRVTENGRELSAALRYNGRIEKLVCEALRKKELGLHALKVLERVFSLNPERMTKQETKILDARIRLANPTRAAAFAGFVSMGGLEDLSVIEATLTATHIDREFREKLALIRAFEYFSLGVGRLFELALNDLEKGAPTAVKERSSVDSTGILGKIREGSDCDAHVCLISLENVANEIKARLIPYLGSENSTYAKGLSDFVQHVITAVESQLPAQKKVDELIQVLVARHRSIKGTWSWIFPDDSGRLKAVKPNIDFRPAHSYRISSVRSLRRELSVKHI